MRMSAQEDYNVAARYRSVRKHLDSLGYKQALSLDALPLIEKLLTDLIQTTESLKHFKTIAQDNVESCSQLQLAIEPYKCDNARLVQECNQLHLDLLEEKEAHQKQIRDLKKQLYKLESECADLQLTSSRNIQKIKELESESSKKSKKILELQGKCCKPVISNVGLAIKKRASYPLRRPVLECDPFPKAGSSVTTLPSLSNVDPSILDLVSMADHRTNSLNREVTKLKGELSLQTDNIQILKTQLAAKEREIVRLKRMLEGGRPYSAISKDCCCRKIDKTYVSDNNELRTLRQTKLDLEERLKEAVDKQHDAMSQAMKLVERNEELEKELRDIDHIALAVEADCNSAVQENNRRVCSLQEKLENVMTQVHVLESELMVERREVQELRADLEACKLEKRNIQRVLESTLDEKKQMTDRINQLTIIEKSLNDEIDRLSRQYEHQKQEIVQLESTNSLLKEQSYMKDLMHVGDDLNGIKENGENNDNKGKKTPKKKTASTGRQQSSSLSTQRKSIASTKEQSALPKENEVTKDVGTEASTYIETQKIIDENNASIASLQHTIERLETERDYYRNEYNKFRDQLNKESDKDKADTWTQASELRRQLNEKERAMTELQREKKELCREKFNLEARLQTYKTQQRRSCSSCIPYSSCGICRPVGPCTCSPPSQLLSSNGNANATKALLERLERERDTARADIERLAEERDALRERLKMAVEAHTSEQRRLRESLTEMEARFKRLERERQELLVTQGTRRATINGLEDQMEDMKQELKRTKEELATQRTQYFQLRALQDQTDQALGDVQGQLSQSEAELNKAMDRNRHIEQQQVQFDNKVKELKEEISALRTGMAQLDQEKDQLLMALDEKTEKIAALERQLRLKEQHSAGVEQQVRELQRKNEICVDQSAEQDRQLRMMQIEMENLQRQVTAASMDRESAIQENRRMQDDLAAVTCECRNLQRELEASQAESYDLKRQLQTYVAEVRRAEDLLNRKENERTEMLNNFRSLSLEATVLENNNHSLESEAAEARGALQSTRDRLLDLERQLTDKDCLVTGYESQIAELTQNVASLETQLRQQGEQRNRAEADLNAVRDLCVKLDQQKETLLKQIGDKDAMKAQCEAQLARLKAEQNMIQDQMDRDHATVDHLETLLSQARQESIDMQTTNQELQNEMTRLKQKVFELEDKLRSETAELRRYQNQAAEYSKQICELRRQMTNERFDRARKEEESRRFGKMTEKTEEHDWKEDLKSKAQHTNRFNTSLPHNSTCKCSENNNKILNNVSCQRKSIDTPCINIILKPDIKTEHKVKEVQIMKLPLDYNNVRNRKNNQILPAISDIISDRTPIAGGSTERDVTLQNTDILPVENNNKYREKSATPNSLELLSTTPQIINLTDNTSSISKQTKFNLTPSHESTRNDLDTSTSKHNVAKTVEKLNPKRTITITETGDTLGKLSKNTTSTTVDLLQTSSKEIPSTRNVKKMKNGISHGKLSEKTKPTIRNLHAKDNKSKDVSKPSNVSEKLIARNLNNDVSGFQYSETDLPYESSVTETSENMSETRETQANLTRTLGPPSTNAISLSSAASNKTPVSITDTSMIWQTPEKMPKINYPNIKVSKLCFCTGPNITPCGTKKLLTQEEISRIPLSKRTDDTCICDNTDVQRGEEFRRIDASGQITGEVTNTDENVTRTNCSTSIDNDTYGYSTSRTQKDMDGGTEKVGRIKSADNLRRSKWGQKQETKQIQTRSSLHGSKSKFEKVADRNMLVSPNARNNAMLMLESTQDSEANRHGAKGITKLQSVETATDRVLKKDAQEGINETMIKYKLDSVTVSDFTKPEFVRLLTEIKEQTRNLERQLAAMNDAMRCKQSTAGNVIDTLSDENKVDWSQNIHLRNFTTTKNIERINNVVDDLIICASDYCDRFQNRQNTNNFNSPYHDEKKTICTSPEVSFPADTSIDKRKPLATSTPINSQIKSKDILSENNLNVSCCIESIDTLAPSLTYKQSNMFICSKADVPDNIRTSTTAVEQSNKPNLSHELSIIDLQHVDKTQTHRLTSCKKKTVVQTSNVSVPENNSTVVNVRSPFSKRKSKKHVLKTKQKNHGCSPIVFRRGTANHERRKKDAIDKNAFVNPSEIEMAQLSSLLHKESMQSNCNLVVSTGCVTESNISPSSSTAACSTPKNSVPSYQSLTINTNNNNIEDVEQSLPTTACVDCQSSNSQIVAATLVTSTDFQPLITSSKIYEEKGTQPDKKLTFTLKNLNTHDNTPSALILKSTDVAYNLKTPSDKDMISRLDLSESHLEYYSMQDTTDMQSKHLSDITEQQHCQKEIKTTSEMLQDDQTFSNCNKCTFQQKDSNVCSVIHSYAQTTASTQHVDLLKDSESHHDSPPRSFCSFKRPKSTSKVKNRTKLVKFRSRIPLLKAILHIRDARQRRNSLPSQPSETTLIANVSSMRQLTSEQIAKCSTDIQNISYPAIVDQQDTPFSDVCHNTFNSEEELNSTNYQTNRNKCNKDKCTNEKGKSDNVIAKGDDYN